MAPVSPVIPFKEKYPIDFFLHNVNNEAAFYVGDPGETLRVEITNTSAAPITVPQDTGRSSSSAGVYSVSKPGIFKLRFRPGILADVEKIKLNTANWTMDPPTTDSDGVLLSFKSKQSFTGTKPVTLKQGESLELTLSAVTVSAHGGSRDTNVELRYENLIRGTQELIQGERLRHFTILNHQGAKHIPLHVGFLQSNQVLNDGSSPNALKLRIANTMKLDPAYPDRSVITLQGGKGDVPTRLIFSFIVGGPEMDWALGTDSQVTKIKINDFGVIGDMLQSAQKNMPKPWKTVVQRAATDGTPKNVDICWKIWAETLGEYFELTMEPTEQAQLKAGEYIELTFSDIITGHPSGITNLHMDYKCIPGYWDGQFTCPIEKTPLIITSGTTAQPARLAMNGRIKDQSGYLVPVGTIVAYAGKTAPEGWLLCDGKAIPAGAKFKELTSLIGANTPKKSTADTVYIVKY